MQSDFFIAYILTTNDILNNFSGKNACFCWELSSQTECLQKSILGFPKACDTKHSDISLSCCLFWIVFIVTFHLNLLWMQEEQTYLKISAVRLYSAQLSKRMQCIFNYVAWHGT